MKLLISTDIEGIAGVFHAEQTRPGNGEYERARAWMTGEANAAVQGAFDAGATAVLVNDSHGGFRNLLPDQIDSRAQLVLGKPRYLGMMAGVETGCDGVFLIGYHCRAQSRGVLAHTINSSAFARVWLNEQELGEAGLYAALAGEFGVPVLMASGDDVFIGETRPLMPWVRYVQTKSAGGFGSGSTLAPAAARDAVRKAASQAVRDRADATPFRIDGPVTCRLQTQTAAHADLFCQWPTLERVDGVTLSFSADSVQSAVRMLNCLSAMSFMLK
ncbi:M55 family metallopeptidase [Cupriavidus pinatubonensis]|uniref:M55 family metallopeptidase n=1 Tax=Cupriavidus pinatubonensis TaxID=248026 RepID=UPI001128FDBD|nr:M55 family metallopeptidase [Cupriavidus pinatubonensis]QYY30128.1 M55 family metallopeptidase [Cupriavidus pinatubonensis]TPQ35163.1 aminopeptidase [Cupriavidus pinatubonensis]